MKRIIALLAFFGLFVASVAACGPAAEPPKEGGPAAEGTPASTEGMTETTPSEAGTEASAADPMAFVKGAQGGEVVVGQPQEPETLYLYGANLLAATHIKASLWESYETLNYDYQPTIFAKLPKLEDAGSGAELTMITVNPGDMMIDPVTQEVMTATETISDVAQLTVKFTMKPGLMWQDGTPLTADDSVFSQKVACSPDTKQSKQLCERTTHYTKIDDQTVEWQGIAGYTDQTYYLNFYTPLPRHYVGAGGKRMDETSIIDIEKDENFSRKPLSYGPFKIDSWTTGDSLVLSRNENYWRKGEGLPQLDKIIHRFFADQNTLLAAAKSGEVDVALQLEMNQYDALEEAKASGELDPHYVIGTSWEHIDFDMDPADEKVVPFGACKDIRHAVAMGADRDTMVNQIQKGKTVVQHSFIGSDHWGYPPADMVVSYKFDPAGANALLDGLGFTAKDADGYRSSAKEITCEITTDITGTKKSMVIPTGKLLEMSLLTTSGNQMRQDSTLLFQQNMKDIGVKVNLVYQEPSVVFGDGPDGPIFGRKFDLAQFGWVAGPQPSVGLYYCTEVPSSANSWGGQNASGWCNPEYDRQGKKAEVTLERPKALPLYHEAQKLFMEELPVLPLFARVKIDTSNPDLVNFVPNATAATALWNSESWGFKEGSAALGRPTASESMTDTTATESMTDTTTGGTPKP